MKAIFLLLLFAGSIFPFGGVIPKLKSITYASDSLDLTLYSMRYIPGDNALNEIIMGLKAEFKRNFGVTAQVKKDTSCQMLFYRMYHDADFIDSAQYKIVVDSKVRIYAYHDIGLYYATRTLMQQMMAYKKVRRGTYVDYPTKQFRGLMIDVGRKYFPPDTMKNIMYHMSLYKMNYLHIHFSDNLGFRLSSAKYPNQMSVDYYTDSVIADFNKFAKLSYINIIPEIDMPGHMAWFVGTGEHTGLQYTENTDAIDITMDSAYTVCSELIDEQIVKFPNSKYWHFGADEFENDFSIYPAFLTKSKAIYGDTAHASQCWYYFIHYCDSIVKSHGKKSIIWSDGIDSVYGLQFIGNDITVDYWSGDNAQTHTVLCDYGIPVINSNRDYTYYALSTIPDAFEAKPVDMWNTFKVTTFYGSAGTPTDPTKVKGANMHIWCDSPDLMTIAEIMDTLKLRLRTMSQITWDTTRYTTFANYIIEADTLPMDTTIRSLRGLFRPYKTKVYGRGY